MNANSMFIKVFFVFHFFIKSFFFCLICFVLWKRNRKILYVMNFCALESQYKKWNTRIFIIRHVKLATSCYDLMSLKKHTITSDYCTTCTTDKLQIQLTLQNAGVASDLYTSNIYLQLPCILFWNKITTEFVTVDGNLLSLTSSMESVHSQFCCLN